MNDVYAADALVRAPRLLPPPDPDSGPSMWDHRADGKLAAPWCAACSAWSTPHQHDCATCGRPVTLRPAAGTGRVFTFTVAHQQFHPEVPTPFVIALVELDEDPILRLLTNIVDVTDGQLAIGMRVQAVFEERGEQRVPVFKPVRA